MPFVVTLTATSDMLGIFETESEARSHLDKIKSESPDAEENKWDVVAIDEIGDVAEDDRVVRLRANEAVVRVVDPAKDPAPIKLDARETKDSAKRQAPEDQVPEKPADPR